MTKSFTQNLSKLFLLIVIAFSSGCGQSTAIDSPPLTPKSLQILTSTPTPTSTLTLLPTVTPVFTREVTISTLSLTKMSSTPEYYSVPTQQPSSECLPPLTNFAFPVGVIRDMGNIAPRAETLPPDYWQVETKLPDDFDFSFGDITVLSNQDIWIKGSINFGEAAYFIYRPNNKSELYLEKSYGKDYQHYVPVRLFQSQDGTLWGVGTAYGNLFEPWEYRNEKPLISRFNENTSQFQYIENILHDADANSGVMDAKFDNQGFIWLLINQSMNGNPWPMEGNEMPPGIYRFNPNTQTVNYFLAMPDDIIFTRLMPVQESIWLLGYKAKSGNETVLLRYFPETGEMQPYKGTFSYYPERDDFPNLDISFSSPLFLDKNNRLWISNEGWLNNPASERPSWYRVIQSPIFIDGGVDGVGNFYRDRPSGMNESSDGNFWFWGYVGTVRLDPEIGEWCLFTTYSSPVVEDKNHALWMVADHKLYKYQLPDK